MVGNLVFLAGEVSRHPQTQVVRGQSVSEQAEFIFENIEATLAMVGSSSIYVAKIVIHLRNIDDRTEFHAARQRFMPQDPPSTLIGGVQFADPAILIEVDAVAAIP